MPAMPAIPSISLNSTAPIPQLGLGTWRLTGAQAQQAVEQALELGYRHIDTAQIYENEAAIGAAIAACGIDRTELFVTTKLHNAYHKPDDARRSIDDSLHKLGLEYVDLFLIHWPVPSLYNGTYPDTWRVMQEFTADGRARHVGVSNFNIHHIQRLIDEVGVLPAVNQIEAHPLFANNSVREFSKNLGIVIEAWKPIVRGELLHNASVQAAAKRLGKTPSQIVLRWHIEREDVVFPMTANPQHMHENMQLFDFELDEAAHALLDAMDRGDAGRTGFDPDTYTPQI